MRAPGKGILRIGAGNVYVGNKDKARAVAVAAGTRSHSWGWAEGAGLARLTRRRTGYKTLSAGGFNFEDPRDADDCIMMVRKGLTVRHFSMTQVCDDAEQRKVAHDRTFSMLAYEWGGLHVCHIAIHPNWIVGFDRKGPGVVREYIKSMRALDGMLTMARSLRWAPVVTGDYNTRKNDRKDYLDVFDVLEKHKLRVRMEGIDGVAWDRRLDLKGWKVIPKRQTGSDHPWIVADFRRRRK